MTTFKGIVFGFFNFAFRVVFIMALIAGILYDSFTTTTLPAETEFVAPLDYDVSMKYVLKDIYVNGHHINNWEMCMPVANLDGKTYVPFSQTLCSVMGLHVEVSDDLVITLTPADETAEQAFDGAEACDLWGVSGTAKYGAKIDTTALGGSLQDIDQGNVIFVSDAMIPYFRLTALPDIEGLGFSYYYDIVSGFYISTDPDIQAEQYYSPNNAAYISGRAAYIRNRRSEISAERSRYYEYMFRHEAAVSGAQEDLLIAVCRCESDFRPDIVSSSGPVGMMQIMPGTGKLYGLTKEDLLDMHKNVRLAAMYIQRNIKVYGGELLGLCAYNQGGGAVTGGTYSTAYADHVIAMRTKILDLVVNKYGGSLTFEETVEPSPENAAAAEQAAAQN